ncbi:MAG: hypothetical protein IH946_08260, partial [Bacteroidetes bacterium]|nr:hypothetical protein [Bacteroidota bacterium]
INSHEYWYGTYEIWINHGEPGGPYGEAGRDGADNYFMLICNPWGFHSHINGTSIGKKWEDEEIVIERDDNSQGFRITVRKTTVDDRTPRSPKLITE